LYENDAAGLAHVCKQIACQAVRRDLISGSLKAIVDRLHTPMRNTFRIRKLALLLVGAAELPELFDAVLRQYQLICSFFYLEDAGTVLVRGVKEKGDILKTDALREAYALGASIETEE
jgi:hypothetical protein